MAHVEKRRRKRSDGTLGPTRWRVRWVDASGRERSRSFDREDDAKRFRTRVEGDVATGSYIDPARARTTLAMWAAEWRGSALDLRVSSLSRLESTVATHVLPEFGDLPLSGISHNDVQKWVARLRASGLSASSVRKAAFALQRIMAAAVADRRLTMNPADGLRLPVEERGEQRFLTVEQVATLADVMAVQYSRCHGPDASGHRFRVLVLLAAYGGLRFGELGALRRRHVDLMRGRVSVSETLLDVDGRLTFGPPKSRNGIRTVPLPSRIAAELGEHIAAYCAEDAAALVFTNTAGQPLRRAGFRRSWWIPAVQSAGLDGLRFHDLRHTFVSLCAAAGIDLGEISKRAGHSSTAFTQDHYRHLYDHADDVFTQRLDKMMDASAANASAALVSMRTSNGIRRTSFRN